MNKPLVSVIIPNYCHSQFLAQRIESVLNQTYQNFEVIILDDCSPDAGASKAVIEKYRGNPHVSHIVYNEENSGSTFKQWNNGIALSKGEYCWSRRLKSTLMSQSVIVYLNLWMKKEIL